MNHDPDDEGHLRQYYLQKLGRQVDAAPPPVDKLIERTVRDANARTGTRDLMTLAFSSFFALVLVFFAPIVAASMSKKGASRSRGTVLGNTPLRKINHSNK